MNSERIHQALWLQPVNYSYDKGSFLAIRAKDHLAALLHQRFVGRAEEKEIFESILIDSTDRPILYFYGPGGVGKTTLISELELIAQSHQLKTHKLDVRYVQPSPVAFEQALAQVLGSASWPEAVTAIAERNEIQVLFLDTFETMASIDDWFRQEFITDLPINLRLVIVSRRKPGSSWKADFSWQSLSRSKQVKNLAPEEIEDYLNRLEVPSELHARAQELTHGHPLALTLIVDTFQQSGEIELAKGRYSDVIQVLLDRFLEGVREPQQRQVLELCAIVRLTTEDLLAETIGEEAAPALFQWLRQLGFIEAGPFGLFPHELARDVLLAELQWRNPELNAGLHSRVRAFYADRLDRSQGASQQSVLFDYIYLHRANPVVQPFFEWNSETTPFLDEFQNNDGAALEASVQAAEGKKSAQAIKLLAKNHPDKIAMVRTGRDNPVGFMTLVKSEDISEEYRNADPGSKTFEEALQKSAPLRKGEQALLIRHWMSFENYQGVSAVQSQIFVNIIRQALSSGSVICGLACSLPNQYEPVLEYGGWKRLPHAQFEVEDKVFDWYVLDWRLITPKAWLQRLGDQELELAASREAEVKPDKASQDGIVFSREQFDTALLEFLKNFSNGPVLRRSSLMRSRIVAAASADEKDKAEFLRRKIAEQAQTLWNHPKDRKLLQALQTSYFQPIGSQEKGAEKLDVSIATYRRHLKQGLERLQDLLWAAETTLGS